ncbi:hypothetical protein HPB49_016120 [Dermacentor silvarum]|uniref:Uncharacterized protein n=1 Tax=Dermacentor silvarum TaxID=543639 RepID=A0ACB8CYG4_DERSI|nr:hypothetical protein HPB49_016120 [Dermacentor silvarum]
MDAKLSAIIERLQSSTPHSQRGQESPTGQLLHTPKSTSYDIDDSLHLADLLGPTLQKQFVEFGDDEERLEDLVIEEVSSTECYILAYFAGFLLMACKEVSSSTHTELEGLKRALASLDETGVNVTEAVTDRHPQVRRSMLQNGNEKVLGLKKKLLQAVKSTGCAAIGLWTRSIVNHLYFSVQCENANGDLAVAVWVSVMNHMQDKHHSHSLLYDRCQHGDLGPWKWIFPGAPFLYIFKGNLSLPTLPSGYCCVGNPVCSSVDCGQLATSTSVASVADRASPTPLG